MNHDYFLNKTIELANENVKNGGGPFASLVVNELGEIIGIGRNSVTKKCDPTAHAEVEAIRDACKDLNHFQLENCILYTSCEPCPMCLGAIYWARPKSVYFAATQNDAAKVGFDDAFIYQEIEKVYEERSIPFYERQLKTKNKPFQTWESENSKTEY